MTFLPSLRRLTAAFLISGVMLVAAAPARAQLEISPEHLAKAREYVEQAETGALYDRTLVEMGVQVMQLLIREDPALRDPLFNALDVVYQAYRQDRDQLYDQFARIYAIRFSIEELQEIIDFYATSTGQKLREQTPTISQDIQTVLAVWSRNTSSEFLARVRAELRNQGYTGPTEDEQAEEAPAQ